MKTLSFVLFASFFALMAAGCPGEEGEVCFEDGDCSSGLICCKTTASATARGRCFESAESCSVAPRPDATTDSGGDAAPDATMDAMSGCTSNAECGETGYCQVMSCSDAVGMCESRPMTCGGVFEPVCGCDGVTYVSACEAARNSASVDHGGECTGAPDTGIMDAGPDATADAAMDAESDASDAATGG